MRDFYELGEQVKNKTALLNFVNEHFAEPGHELIEVFPSDWVPFPSTFQKIEDVYLRRWALHLHRIWRDLCRRVSVLILELTRVGFEITLKITNSLEQGFHICDLFKMSNFRLFPKNLWLFSKAYSRALFLILVLKSRPGFRVDTLSMISELRFLGKRWCPNTSGTLFVAVRATQFCHPGRSFPRVLLLVCTYCYFKTQFLFKMT